MRATTTFFAILAAAFLFADARAATMTPVQKIYWSDFNAGVIQRSDPVGSNVETVVNTQA